MTYEEIHETLKAVWAVEGIKDFLPSHVKEKVFMAIHGAKFSEKRQLVVGYVSANGASLAADGLNDTITMDDERLEDTDIPVVARLTRELPRWQLYSGAGYLHVDEHPEGAWVRYDDLPALLRLPAELRDIEEAMSPSVR